MPLYTQFAGPEYAFAIWRITEELSFFESKFQEPSPIQNPNKRLQWYATRYLAKQMIGDNVEILKDESGKPYLKNSSHHISISHTSQFAAFIFSERVAVGIDMEMVHPKVERIAHKFLRDDEIESIAPIEKIQKLILYWSAKEALYKLYGKTQIEFTTQLLLEPFVMQPKGEIKARIAGTSLANLLTNNLAVRYEFFDSHVMCYVVGR